MSLIALLLGVACSPTKRNYDDADTGGTGGGGGMGDGGAASGGMAGGVASGGGGNPADTEGPTVLEVSPEPDESDVSVDTIVSVLFSEEVKESTLNADSFTLRNQIGGLVSSGSLQLDDGALGVFTPESPLQRGTMYTATVTTDVTDLAGNPLSADEAWSFVTEAPTWGTAALIEMENLGNANYPQVAIDAAGNAVAVWEQSNGTLFNIWANRYVVGSGWGTATLIESNDQGPARYPQVAVDSSGNAVAVWQQSDGTRFNIWANRYVVGSGWGTTTLVETDDAGAAESPQVAVDSNGNAIAVWRQSDGSSAFVWANHYDVESGWGTATLVDDVGGVHHLHVGVAPKGDAVAVWQQYDGSRYNIRASRYDVESGWGAPTFIETEAGSATVPSVAVDAVGNAVAVWEQSDGTRNRIRANRYVVGSGWGMATVIEAEADVSNVYSARVAVDPAGNAVAVWRQADGSGNSILANRYDVESGWGTATVIHELGGSATNPQVAIDAAGNAVAVWQWQQEGIRTDIWAARYVAGSGWEAPTLIETDNASGANSPQVAIDAAGNAVAVWSQSDGTRNNIWANRLQ